MSEASKNKASGNLQVVVFKLGHEEYGLMIDQIKEVVLTPAITRMPQTPSYMKGVANIRGNVIAILDLANRFALTDAATNGDQYKYTLVVESEDLKMGLLVHEVPHTVTVAASELDDSVGIIADGNIEGNYIKGIIKTGKRLIILIDIFKVVDQESGLGLRKATSAAA